MYHPDRHPPTRRPVASPVERLEPRQLLSGTLTVGRSLMVFNAVQGDTSQVETLTLTNTGTSALSLAGATVVADPTQPTDASARFAVTNALPATLAAGASFGLTVDYTAAAVGLDYATLDLASNDPAHPTTTVALHGIGTAGEGGVNQPSLERILLAYDMPNYDRVGETDITSAYYPEPPAANDTEVDLQQMVKAGPGDVTFNVLASFVGYAATPLHLGWYNPADPTGTKQELFHTDASDYQSVYVQPIGDTSFDPGSTAFGLYNPSQTVKVNGQLVTGYTQDALNTDDTTDPRKFRFFPLENADGSAVANSYIMTSTEWPAPVGYDFTNIVAIISNVKPAAPVAAADTATATAASPAAIDVRANDTATTGTLAAVTITTAPASGGTAAFDPATGTVTYTAPDTFAGTDTFAYTVTNSAGYTSAPATVTVAVTGGAVPIAAAVSATTVANAAVRVNVGASATAAAGLNLASVAVTAPAHGTAVAAADGSVTYTPAAGFVGADAFTYTVASANGVTSNSAPVTVDVGVRLGTGGARSLSFSQPSGKPATVTLNRGTADVAFNGTGTLTTTKAGRATITGTALSIAAVALSGTTAASTLTTTAASIAGLTDAAPMGGVVAPKATLTGTVDLPSLSTLRAASLDGATVSIAGALHTAVLGSVTGSTITAATIDALTVTGIIATSSVTTTGNVGRLTAAALTGDTVRVGAAATSTLASVTAATAGTATLATLRLTGRAGDTFAASTVIAATITNAVLGRVQTDADGVTDGLAVGTTKSVTGTADGKPFRVSRTTATDAVFGDFRINLLND